MQELQGYSYDSEFYLCRETGSMGFPVTITFTLKDPSATDLDLQCIYTVRVQWIKVGYCFLDMAKLPKLQANRILACCFCSFYC